MATDPITVDMLVRLLTNSQDDKRKQLEDLLLGLGADPNQVNPAFIQRMTSQDQQFIRNPGGGRSTVEMASSDNVAFPTIANMGAGLTRMPPRDAYRQAMDTGNYVPFKDDLGAQIFAEGAWKRLMGMIN